MKKKVAYFFIIFFFSSLPAISGKTCVIPNNLNGKILAEHFEFFEDKTGQLTFEDIQSRQFQFVPNSNKKRCFGITASTYWIKIQLQNITDRTIKFYFEFDYPIIDKLDLIFETDKGISKYIAGDYRNFNSRPIPYTNPLFPVEQGPGLQNYYFKISGDSNLKMSLKIWDTKTFDEKIPKRYILTGFNSGILFAVILYNIISFLWQKKWIYFWFSCCSITGSLGIMYLDGIIFQVTSAIIPPVPQLYNYFYIITHYIGILFWLLFFNCFITEKTSYYKTIKILITGSIIVSLSFFIPSFEIILYAVILYHIFSFIVVYILFVYHFYKQKPYLLIISGLTIQLIFLLIPFADFSIPQIFSGLGFLLITVGMVIYSNEFNLEKQDLMISIQRAENVKSEFIHSVAHNLKTPLVALMFSSQMLKNILKENKEAQHFLDKILRNATWLSNFIENFFEFYKNDKFELNIKKVSLKLLISGIVGELGDINKYRHNILFNQSEDMEDYFINIDKSIIEQVLLNVVENAIKYSTIKKEKGTIIIDVIKHPDEIVLTIADNGIGISTKAMGNIYDAFFRANEDDQYGGTGLGLTISKKFIDAHGGRLYCISPAPQDHSPYLYLDNKRKGTVFYIHLPTNLKENLTTEEDK